MKRLTVVLILLFVAGCGQGSAPAPAPAQASAPAKPADEPAVIRILGEINTAQAEYIKRYRRYALTFEELIDVRLIQEEPKKDVTGYDVKLRPSADAGSYTMIAVPVSPSSTSRYFFTDKTGVIHAEQGKEANAASPQI